MDESRKLERTWLCSIVFSDIVNYSSQSVELQMKWKQYFNDVLTEALSSVRLEQVVYKLTPASPVTSSAATPTSVEENSTKTPNNRSLAQRRPGLLMGGLGALLLIALIAVLVLRSKHQTEPQNTATQVRQSP